VSAILFRRFLARPLQVAYVLPSSRALIGRVLQHMDFSVPRTVVEFGGGEGCYTRELAKRLAPGSRILVFELDPQLAEHLRKQFADDPRVLIYDSDAAHFRDKLRELGLTHADYVISGIPFSYIEPRTKKEILHAVHDGLSPDGLFLVYQVTMELKGHARMFAACEVEYFLANIPPMFVLAFHKTALTLRKRGGRKSRGKASGRVVAA
jgi:phospholipid N-methyltransferase